MNYTNIGRAAAGAGEWNGVTKTIHIPANQLAGPDSDGWVLVLQSGNRQEPGVILAAAKSPGL